MIPNPHGQAKYPNSTLVMSSAQRHWPGIAAELRSHRMSDGPGYSADQIEVTFLVKGCEGGAVACKFGKDRMPVNTQTGTAWVCPAGVQADEILIAAPDLTSAHLYIPPARLDALAMDGDLRFPDKPSLRSAAVPEDGVISQLGRIVLAEAASETSAGRLLVDSAATTLAAWLIRNYAEHAPRRTGRRPPPRLDERRLRRVLDYVEQHLDEDISLESLSRQACLSEFHFARMFAGATGMPPYRYVSRRRLERAASMLAEGKLPLTEIAFRSGFSSQASFTRAFRRTMGVAPGEYRRHIC